MKPPTPKPPPAVGDTQVIDLHDVELLIAAQTEQDAHRRSLPPPLPPEVRASHVPSEPLRASPSLHPSQAPARRRSTAFYIVALLVVLVLGVGVGGGVFATMTPRRGPPRAATSVESPHVQGQATITIPVVEVGDDPDSGK